MIQNHGKALRPSNIGLGNNGQSGYGQHPDEFKRDVTRVVASELDCENLLSRASKAQREIRAHLISSEEI